MSWLRNNPMIAGLGGLVGLAIAAYLAFGVFGVQTLFTDDKVAEANPFEAGAGPSGLESDETTEELASKMNDEMQDAPEEVEMTEETPDMPEVMELSSGMFEGRSHPGSGTAVVISDGDRTFLRFEEDFSTDNGPDLNVYLSKAPTDADAAEFAVDPIDLGDLSGNIGSQNYEIDPSVDLSEYQSVVVWCVRFDVAFTVAPIQVS